MSQAFVSATSLFRHRLLDAQGRLATIWFDKIILHTSREDVAMILERAVSDKKMRCSTADELLKIWSPVNSALPGYVFLSRPGEHHNDHLKKTVARITVEATKADFPDMGETQYDFQREVAWAGAGLLESLACWCVLNEAGACTLLPNEREAAVVNRVFTSSSPSGIETFSAIASSRIPDLMPLTWEKVLELRHHPHLEQFRAKISLIESAVRRGSNREAVEILSEMELADLRALAKLVKPSVKSSVLKAIATNIPLPIPFNPISIGLSAKDVANTVAQERTYGWLYFLLDLPR